MVSHCAFCQRELIGDEVCDCQEPVITPTSGSGGNGGGTTGGATGTGNGNVVGIYSDTEDKTTGDNSEGYTVQDILNWARGRSKTLRHIIDKLEKEGRIKVVSGDSTCHYNSQTKEIILPEDVSYSVESVTHEIIHYLQDENGMLNIDSCGSDNEYQAYVINYILDRAYNKSFAADGNAPEPQGVESTKAWDNFKINLDSELSFQQGGYTYTQKFIDDLNKLNHVSLSETFRSYYEAIDENRLAKGADKKTNENYYKHYKKDYNYNWEELFDKLGFTKK